MQVKTELWSESRTESSFEVIGSLVREELEKETVLRIDLSYLGNTINQWWSNKSQKAYDRLAHSALKQIILLHIKQEDLNAIRNVGRKRFGVSATLLEHMFSISDKELGLLVHEVMSEISGITDIKYPYEEHKELFPKNDAKESSDWGKGLGVIRPHSDDLYESREVNAMALTVCKDTSSTPTWFWLIKDVVSVLTDEELGQIAVSSAEYISGTNVEGRVITVKKSVLRRDPNEGLGFRLDFRVDDRVGARMQFNSTKLQKIYNKMANGFRRIKPVCTNPSTGSVSILSNYKILHGRSALDPIMLYEGESSRILFRTKGIK